MIRFIYIFTVFHRKVCHISTLSLIGNIALYSYIMRNGVIPVLALRIVQSTKKTEKRWVIQLFLFFLIKSLIILDNTLMID